MPWVPFDSYLKGVLTGEFTAFVDHDLNTFKIALITSTLAPARATHDYWNDLSANEVSGTNYTVGGNALATPTVTVASNIVTWDAVDPATWVQSGSGFSNARYAILYKDTGTGATSNLIAYYDFVSDKGNVAGDLTLQLDSAGISTLAAA